MRRHKKTNCEAVYQSGVHAWAVPKIGNGSLVCVECKRSIGLGELATTAYLLKSIVRGYLTRHGEAKAAKLKDGIAQATRHLFSRGAVVVGRDGEVEGGGGGIGVVRISTLQTVTLKLALNVSVSTMPASG